MEAAEIGDRVFVCTNEKDTVESIAIAHNNENNLRLELLATNPNNISSSTPSESSPKIKGFGTTLMDYLFKTCVTEGKDKITLSPTMSSIAFFKSLGLSPDSETLEMFITSEKIRSLPKFSKTPPIPSKEHTPKNLDYLDLAKPRTPRSTRQW
ncbi:MAG: hypothetical protein JSS09_04565 [Verrucomicrobia bacterium]|nr:hypothetical protein [Verrucomicrobiota bacterium]